MNILGRSILSADDMRAALALRNEWRSDPFSDWQAAGRLLMSPPKVRDLMQRLVISGLAGCRIEASGNGSVRHTYRMRVDPAPAPDRYALFRQEVRDDAIWGALERTAAKIIHLKGRIG